MKLSWIIINSSRLLLKCNRTRVRLIIFLIVIASILVLVALLVLDNLFLSNRGRLRGLINSAVGHISTAPGFKPRPGYARRVFHLSLRLIILWRSLGPLSYFVHKGGRKTSIFTFMSNRTHNGNDLSVEYT